VVESIAARGTSVLVAGKARLSARAWWFNWQSRRAPRAKASDDVGAALEPEVLEGRRRQRGREAFVAEDDPGDVVVDGLGNAGFAAPGDKRVSRDRAAASNWSSEFNVKCSRAER
jgi:hypothetical protein